MSSLGLESFALLSIGVLASIDLLIIFLSGPFPRWISRGRIPHKRRHDVHRQSGWVIFEKDLGEKTAQIASQITQYNPDKSGRKVQ